jgi:hypothetical protein
MHPCARKERKVSFISPFACSHNCFGLTLESDVSMDGSAANRSLSDVVELGHLYHDQEAFDSLEIAIDERLFQDSVHLASSDQEYTGPESHRSDASASLDIRERTREAGELNFDVLMKRCEDDMELVIGVLEAFCAQGAASCCELEIALETKDDSQLYLQAVCSISIPDCNVLG